jgi:phage N-6-adenine-methyltransferase
VLRARARGGERIGLDNLTPPKQRGTGEFEWYTPIEWLDRARKVLGAFDLDPATSLVAQRTVKAKRFYTLDDDGLTKQWRGRVWMNPPYAQPAIQHFADKLVDEVEAGHVTAAIALTNDCTDTQWFHRLARAAQGVSFPVGRIRFYSPRGDLANPAPGQVLFYFGDNFGRFETVFGDTGCPSSEHLIRLGSM